MKILITGGCGFLGSNIAKTLLEKNHELMIIDNLQRHGSKKNFEWLKSSHDFIFLKNDIVELETLSEDIIKFNPTTILHLAGQVAMTTSLEDPHRDFLVNAYGTFKLLELIRISLPSSKIIYSSTNKVYGDLEHLNYKESETRYEIENYEAGIPD